MGSVETIHKNCWGKLGRHTYDTYDVTDRGPDGPCDQISAGYQVSVVELSYTLSLLPWGAHAWDRRLGLSSSSASQS